jgi:hypothetical protein
VIIAAGLCPWPPVLARELTGRDPVVPELRKACAEAAERLLRAEPELIALVGPAGQTRRWDPDSRLHLPAFAPALAGEGGIGLGTEGDPVLPPSLGLGALLLDQAGYAGPRVLQAVADYEEAASCAELGTAIGGLAGRVGLLVMGDGSARRSPAAPGYYDERAADFDAMTCEALRRGDLDALLAIDPGLARELMATGRPAWQVLAGAMRPGRTSQSGQIATDILYSDAPFGVGYLVASLTPQ